MKQCGKCNRYLKFDNFYKNKNNKDGLQSICKECFKQYYQNNYERIRNKQNEYKKQYRLNHPHMLFNDHIKERHGLESNITEEQYFEILAYFHYTCAYCGCDLDYNNLTLDHIAPLSLGGTTDIWNIVPCCKSCNSSKNNKMYFIQWLASKDIINPYQLEFIMEYIDKMHDKYNN